MVNYITMQNILSLIYSVNYREIFDENLTKFGHFLAIVSISSKISQRRLQLWGRVIQSNKLLFTPIHTHQAFHQSRAINDGKLTFTMGTHITIFNPFQTHMSSKIRHYQEKGVIN